MSYLQSNSQNIELEKQQLEQQILQLKQQINGNTQRNLNADDLMNNSIQNEVEETNKKINLIDSEIIRLKQQLIDSQSLIDSHISSNISLSPQQAYPRYSQGSAVSPTQTDITYMLKQTQQQLFNEQQKNKQLADEVMKLKSGVVQQSGQQIHSNIELLIMENQKLKEELNMVNTQIQTKRKLIENQLSQSSVNSQTQLDSALINTLNQKLEFLQSQNKENINQIGHLNNTIKNQEDHIGNLLTQKPQQLNNNIQDQNKVLSDLHYQDILENQHTQLIGANQTETQRNYDTYQQTLEQKNIPSYIGVQKENIQQINQNTYYYPQQQIFETPKLKQEQQPEIQLESSKYNKVKSQLYIEDMSPEQLKEFQHWRKHYDGEQVSEDDPPRPVKKGCIRKTSNNSSRIQPVSPPQKTPKRK